MNKKEINQKIYIELDNLRRELDYYVLYEPENEEAMSKIENKIEELTDKLV